MMVLYGYWQQLYGTVRCYTAGGRTISSSVLRRPDLGLTHLGGEGGTSSPAVHGRTSVATAGWRRAVAGAHAGRGVPRSLAVGPARCRGRDWGSGQGLRVGDPRGVVADRTTTCT